MLAAVFGIAVVANTNASTIGPDCTTCQGSTYTLTNLGLAPTDLNTADGSFDTWRIALTIDTSGYTGSGVEIDQVAIKVSSSVDAASLVSAPGVWYQPVYGGLNSNGCSGSGSGFECTNGVGILAPLMTWVFDVDIASPLFTGIDQASIKVRYVDEDKYKAGALVSEDISLSEVPEPATLSLLALGGGAVFLRRRRA